MQAHGRTSSSPHPLIIPLTRQSMPMSSTSQIWTFSDTCMLPPTAIIRASNGPCDSLSFRNAIMFTVSIGASSVRRLTHWIWAEEAILTPLHMCHYETPTCDNTAMLYLRCSAVPYYPIPICCLSCCAWVVVEGTAYAPVAPSRLQNKVSVPSFCFAAWCRYVPSIGGK